MTPSYCSCSCSYSYSPFHHHNPSLFLPNTPKPNSKPTTKHHPSPIINTKMSSSNHPPSPTSAIKTLTKFLWGPSLPPGLLISTVRFTWTSTWQLMMSQLAPSDPTGNYSRPSSQFRITRPDNTRHSGKLHLYVGLPCPWAHRTLIVRALKGLEDSIPISIASPGLDGSWVFGNEDKDKDKNNNSVLIPGKDRVNGCGNMREVYGRRRGGYSGRCTVPMLWDVERNDVACNESYDIIELFNSGLNGLARSPDLDLSPPGLKGEIDYWNGIIYPNVNNGVYRCGFAQSQEAYDKAVNELFTTLEMLDDHLSKSRYLCGEALTLADVCLLTTLVRFDLVYNVLFKCTKKKLVEYPHLHGYMRDIYQIPKVAATCNFEAIMDGYYKFLFPLNPGNIRPVMPSACEHETLSRPHNREYLSVPDRSQVEAL